MKKYQITFWVTVIIIFLFEGVLSGLTSQTEFARQGITLLAVFKVLGSLALVIPMVPRRVKEWAYAGFGIDFISAFVSLWVVDGLNFMLLLPLTFIIILIISYISFNKIKTN
jgi:hypothetical protein